MYQIKPSCSGCHTCELACPMQAINYDGPRYQIDPDKCVSCGLCETLCPTCSIYDPEEKKTVTPHEKIVKECDLVVCGGGTGLISAIKAAQLGLKVIVLEKPPVAAATPTWPMDFSQSTPSCTKSRASKTYGKKPLTSWTNVPVGSWAKTCCAPRFTAAAISLTGSWNSRKPGRFMLWNL